MWFARPYHGVAHWEGTVHPAPWTNDPNGRAHVSWCGHLTIVTSKATGGYDALDYVAVQELSQGARWSQFPNRVGAGVAVRPCRKCLAHVRWWALCTEPA